MRYTLGTGVTAALHLWEMNEMGNERESILVMVCVFKTHMLNVQNSFHLVDKKQLSMNGSCLQLLKCRKQTGVGLWLFHIATGFADIP